MSLINKMLRELDKRHAMQTNAPSPPIEPGAAFNRHLRPVKERSAATWIWALSGSLAIVALAMGAWLAWNLGPRWKFSDALPGATHSPRSTDAPVRVTPIRPAPAPSTGDAAVLASPPLAAAAPQSVSPVASPPGAVNADGSATISRPGTVPKPDMLQMTTNLAVPLAGIEPKASVVAKERSSRSRDMPGSSELVPLKPDTLPRKVASAESKIDRRSDTTPRERAESEYRRAMSLVGQGRVAEGMQGVRGALSIDPGYHAARQTLVSLMFDAKRFDEARSVLQEGLALDPSQSGFAMLLARVMTERGEAAGALAVLQKHGASAEGNADYHAFEGALYQRLGRHLEAIAEYQAALRLEPASAAWWVGLGISLQATDQSREALDAFRRAKASGGLPPNLVAFVDQRLRQLQ